MSDTEVLAPVPRVVDDLSIVVTERATPPNAPGVPQALRDGTRHVVANGLTIFVALCIGLLVFLTTGTALMHSRYQRALRDEFRRNDQNLLLPPLTTTDSSGVTTLVPIHPGAAVALLRIPKIHVEEVISEGTTSSNTLRGPGHLTATPLPGQLGNVVVIGRHATGGAPFADLGSLHPGDRFSFVVAGGVANYTVMSVSTHKASDMTVFATQQSGGHRLDTATLVTTKSLFDASHRLVVVGRLQGTPAGFTPGRVAPNPEELGLAADHGGLVPLVLALQLLLMASVGAVWLSRRWHRHAAWIMSTPVLLCTAWLVFEQFSRVLPAAL